MTLGRQPLVCILSTGRAGSKYISIVLSRAGVSCGHEIYYTPSRIHRSRHVAESSWLALPRVESGHFAGTCFHQVRHPLQTISSFLNGEMWTNANRSYAAFQQINMHADVPAPCGRDLDSWLAFTVEYVLEWNARCEEQAQECGGFTYRLEDVDVHLVREIGSAAGVDVTEDRAERALEKTSRRLHKHPDGPQLDWGDLPDIPASEDLHKWAAEYGYE